MTARQTTARSTELTNYRAIHVEGVSHPPGSKLLAIKPYSETDRHLSVILCVCPRDAEKIEYVTWTYNWTTQDCSCGHYFRDDHKAALKDFYERGIK